MAGLLDDDDIERAAPPPLAAGPDVAPLGEDDAEDGQLEDGQLEDDAAPDLDRYGQPPEDEPVSPVQTARADLQATTGALLRQLRADVERMGGLEDLEPDTAAAIASSIARAAKAKTDILRALAEVHPDILTLQAIPDPTLDARDRGGKLSRLAAALRQAHGQPVTTRPPGEE